MTSRKLVLRREALTELSSNDLGAVAAAAVAAGSGSCFTYTVIPTGCNCTGMYPSLNDPCHSTELIYSGGC